MKRIYLYIYSIILLVAITSCDKDLEISDNYDYMTNFEFLWKEVDQKYCYFEYKKDSIKDWNDVYVEYKAKVEKCHNDRELFAIFSDMLNELKDGHVNIFSPFDVSHYDIQTEAPDNFSAKVLKSDNYLTKNKSFAAGGFRYIILNDNIGYIRYSSFSNDFSEENLDSVLSYLKNTDGIIFDVRDNGGGNDNYVEAIAKRFFISKKLVGYQQYKDGTGHNDFSKPKSVHIEPGGDFRYNKKVAVLINRNVYSAANDFASVMRYAGHSKLFGDRTGGGGGFPLSSELPNGWTFRLSVNPMTDADKNHIEYGIEPDVKVDMSPENEAKNIDDIIEAARSWILQ